MYTHYFSSHPLATKKGVLIGLFTRALRLCSNEHLVTEFNHISRAFSRLQYPDYIIRQALSKAKSRFYNPVVRQRPKFKYFLRLPCHPALEAIRYPLSKLYVSTSYSSSNTLRSHLCRTGPRRPTSSELPGVYKIECVQCPEGVYYGETGNSLDRRRSDHTYAITNGDDSNALVCHMDAYPGHTFDLDSASLVYISNMERKRQLVESSVIHKLFRIPCNST